MGVLVTHVHSPGSLSGRPRQALRARRAALGLLLAALAAAPGWAQTSRTAEIEAQQAEKAKALKPRTEPGAERAFKWVKRELIDQPSGLYPLFGSVYAGGGFTLGAGYRHYVGDNTHIDAKILQSLRNYRLLELSADSWNHGGGRVDLHLKGGRRTVPDAPFYGLGIDSTKDSVGFELFQNYASGEIAVRPVSVVHLSGGVGLEDYTIGDANGARPAISSTFTPGTAPALDLDPRYTHATASAAIDWRSAAGYARRGGFYGVRYHRYSGGPDDFARLEGQAVQHLPLLRENYVLSLRGEVESILDDTSLVPFYLLPSLGGGSTLRGYSSWRFRDRHSALTSAELRWIPNRNMLDVALFYDAGMVAPRFDDLSFRRFRSDYGIGVRFHSPMATPLRIDVAKSPEGLRLVFSGSAAF